MIPFTRTVTIRFAHCDPAGIVFFPHFFALINEMVEDWFAGPLGASFKNIHIDAGMGVPTVRFEAEFMKPARLGDEMRQTLAIAELGASSCTLVHEAWREQAKLARFRQTIVYVNLAAMKPSPWPAALRERMLHFVETG